MILIDSDFWGDVGVVSNDGNPDGSQYDFYNYIEMSNGETAYNQYDFFKNSPVNGVYVDNQYDWYKAIGVLHVEPIYDEYSFYQNVTFDGINAVGNQYEFFKFLTSAIEATQNLCQYNFNGTTQYLDFGDVLDSVLSGVAPEFTLEFWVKRDTITGNQAIFSKHDSPTGNRQILLQFNAASGQMQYIQSSDGSNVFSVNSDVQFTEVDEWVYVALSVDYTAPSFTTAVQMYKQGVGVDSTASTPTFNPIYASTSPIVIGATNTNGTATNFLDGSVRDVVITDRVKTPTEIEARFNYGNLSAPSATDLELHANFKTDTFSTNWIVEDLSTNAYDGASVNMLVGDRTCEDVEFYSNVVIDGFTNSIDYTVEALYTKRSTAAEFNFNFTGTELWVKSFVDGTNTLAVMVDGVLDQSISLVSGDLTKITLAAGAKYVQLIESARGAIDYKGSSMYQIILLKSEYTKVSQVSVVDRFVFLGDSITQGSTSDSPTQINGYASQFIYTDSKPVTILGYAGGTVAEMANTNLSTTLSWVTDAFQNTTGRKVLTIMLGTNDFALSALASNVNNQYISLVDGINANDSDIEIFVITPTLRTDDAALLDTYRANQVTMCTTRSFATSIDGKPILDLADLTDAVHPNQVGHTKIHDAIDSIIL